MFFIKSTLSVPDFKTWVISISKGCDWTIGDCDDTYGNYIKDGYVYGLRCRGNQLLSLTTESNVVMKETPRVIVFGMLMRKHYL